MGGFVKGDVVVLPFPFSNLRASKKRPALVIAPVEPYDDVILCMITSTSAKDASAIPISQADFESGGLPHASFIRPNRLFTADAGIVVRQAGRLSGQTIEQVVGEIVEIIST